MWMYYVKVLCWIGKEVKSNCMCVCFIATRGTLQHVSACMGHLQVISYNTRIPSLV
jgi:hypothetical protein